MPELGRFWCLIGYPLPAWRSRPRLSSKRDVRLTDLHLQAECQIQTLKLVRRRSVAGKHHVQLAENSGRFCVRSRPAPFLLINLHNRTERTVYFEFTLDTPRRS
jgi:hypothetical protein